MSNQAAENPPVSAPPQVTTSPPPPRRSIGQRVSLVLQLVLSIAVACGVFVYIMWSGTKAPSPDDSKRPTPTEEVVQLAGPQTIRVRSGTPLDRKLQIASVSSALLS